MLNPRILPQPAKELLDRLPSQDRQEVLQHAQQLFGVREKQAWQKIGLVAQEISDVEFDQIRQSKGSVGPFHSLSLKIMLCRGLDTLHRAERGPVYAR